VVASESGGGLEEGDRLLGCLPPRLARVVGVVEADADDLARPRDWRAETLGVRDARRLRGLLLGPACESREAVRLEEALAPVLAEAGGVDARPVAELQPGLLAARRSETDELHSTSSRCEWRQRSIATATPMITPIRISCT